MTNAPEIAETRAAVPEVIYLPDQRQRTKKVTSGSSKRRRQHLERFRTDDVEHAALQEKMRASGLSLGGYVMKLAAIESGKGARDRQRPHPAIDAVALVRAQVAFSRANNNLNQIAHAANRLALDAAGFTPHTVAGELRELHRAIDAVRAEFAAPLAAILEAMRPPDDREG